MPVNLVTRSVEWMLLLRENTETPSDAEWNACLDLLGAYRPHFGKVKVLVVTDGGGPTIAQRRRLSDVAGGHPLRSAVVSESMKVRFIVSSVALFLPGLASFRNSELSEAYAHLVLEPREMILAEKAMQEMSMKLTTVRSGPLMNPGRGR